MNHQIPKSVLISTSLGLCLSTTFSVASLSLTYFAIPSILLPSDAPLFPPLELVTDKNKRRYGTEKAPKQPLDSGVGDEKETMLDSGATEKILSRDGMSHRGSPSETSYILRQWFHLFSKGMHSLPPCVLGSGALYVFSAGVVEEPQNRGCFAVAAILSVCTMIFTLTALKPVNSALHARVQEVVKQEQGDGTMTVGVAGHVDDKRAETEALVRKWGRMNAWRALIPVVAAVFAISGLIL